MQGEKIYKKQFFTGALKKSFEVYKKLKEN